MEKVFVYGIFTESFTRYKILGDISNQWYMELRGYSIRQHSRVPFKTIFESDMTSWVQGLILEVTPEQLKLMDKIESIDRGLYRRVKIDDFWVYME